MIDLSTPCLCKRALSASLCGVCWVAGGDRTYAITQTRLALPYWASILRSVSRKVARTLLITDLHDSAISDGSYVEGPRKLIAIMLKDKKKYAATGGWGFQAWAGGDPKKPLVTDPTKQCFECHQPKKDQDYVYSTYIP